MMSRAACRGMLTYWGAWRGDWEAMYQIAIARVWHMYLYGFDQAVWDAREAIVWHGVSMRMDDPTGQLGSYVCNSRLAFMLIS